MKVIDYRICCVTIATLVIFIATGCSKSVLDGYYIYTDEDTCVEYFVSNSSSNIGNFNPRYNQDGTLKLNEGCLNQGEK